MSLQVQDCSVFDVPLSSDKFANVYQNRSINFVSVFYWNLSVDYLQVVLPLAVVLLAVPPDHFTTAVPLPVDETSDESFSLLSTKKLARLVK